MSVPSAVLASASPRRRRLIGWLGIEVSHAAADTPEDLTAALAPLYAGLLMGWGNPAVTVLVIALLLVYRHKSNLIKLATGQEARIGARK